MQNNDYGQIDLLSRVKTKEERERENAKNLETDNAKLAYQQERAAQAGEYEQVDAVRGQSLLSPNNLQAQKPSERVSPFSDEYIKIAEEKRKQIEEIEESEEGIPSERIQFYLAILFFFYIIALGIGYHYTSFSEDIPQVISMKRIDANEYLSKIDDYVLTLQTLHEETVSSIEGITYETVGESEINSRMEKSNKKLSEMQSELKDISVPEGFETIQSQLIELYSLQIAMNNATATYAKTKSDNSFNILENSNEKFEDNIQTFLTDYEKKFY